MTTPLVRGPRPWGVAFLSLLAVTTGYRATNAPSDEPAAVNYAVERAFAPDRRVLHSSDQLAIPVWMTIVGSRLVVIDLASDSALHIIDRSTGALVRSFGRRGGGPGEFESVWSLDPVAGSGSELWVYDNALNRMNLVDLRHAHLGQRRLGKRSVNLAGSGTLTGVIRTNQEQFLGTGFFPGGRLGVFDEDGKLVAVRGQIPVVERNVEPVLRQYMFQSRAASHPAHHLLAVASRYASSLEIYRSDGSLVAMGDAPLPIRPDPELVSYQYGYVQEDDTKLGYVDVTASRDFVFALFSGRTYAGYEGRENFGREVHVFDWDGALRGVVQLEVDVIGLAVDEDANSLYVAEHDPVPTISQYDLAGMDFTAGR